MHGVEVTPSRDVSPSYGRRREDFLRASSPLFNVVLPLVVVVGGAASEPDFADEEPILMGSKRGARRREDFLRGSSPLFDLDPPWVLVVSAGAASESDFTDGAPPVAVAT